MRRPDLTVRFRVDFGPRCSIGIGKIELLEGIVRTGSLSQAAKQMRMSYRRAWLLLADLNQSFDEPIAITAVGGRGGGGVLLTPFGKRLVAGYRRMESALQPLADTYLAEFDQRTRATPAMPTPAATKNAAPMPSKRRLRAVD